MSHRSVDKVASAGHKDARYECLRRQQGEVGVDGKPLGSMTKLVRTNLVEASEVTGRNAFKLLDDEIAEDDPPPQLHRS